MTETASKLRKTGHVILSANQGASPEGSLLFLWPYEKRGGGLKRGTTG